MKEFNKYAVAVVFGLFLDAAFLLAQLGCSHVLAPVWPTQAGVTVLGFTLGLYVRPDFFTSTTPQASLLGPSLAWTVTVALFIRGEFLLSQMKLELSLTIVTSLVAGLATMWTLIEVTKTYTSVAVTKTLKVFLWLIVLAMFIFLMMMIDDQKLNPWDRIFAVVMVLAGCYYTFMKGTRPVRNR